MADKWRDDVAEEGSEQWYLDQQVVPPNSTSIDGDVKTSISYDVNGDNEITKTITKTRITKIAATTSEAVARRMALPKFGSAVSKERGIEHGITVEAADAVDLALSHVDVVEADQDVDIATNNGPGFRYRVMRCFQEKPQAPRMLGESSAPISAAFDNQKPCSIRITNLGELANSDDIKKLAAAFGETKRVSVPTDRATGVPRGFAFVTFATHKQAEKALEALNGHRYGHMVLACSWAEDRNR